jgi:hypothetical protein
MPSKKLRARARRTTRATRAPTPTPTPDVGACEARRAWRRIERAAELVVPVCAQVASAGGGLSAPQIEQRLARARIRARLITKLVVHSGHLVTDLFDVEGYDDNARAELCAIALAQLDDQADQARRAQEASGAE